MSHPFKTLATFALAGLVAALSTAQALDTQIYVESKAPDASVKIANLLKGGGKIRGRMGESMYRIVVPSKNAKAFEQRLTSAGFKVSRQEIVPKGAETVYRSLNSLQARIGEAERLRAQNGGKGYGTGYLKALESFTKARAYPYQTIDWSAYQRAEVTRRLLRQYTPQGNQRNLPAAFEYVGPRNLDIPYRTYYGQPPLGGRTNALAYDPSNPSTTFYAGAANGGVWKTTDNGLTWTPLSNLWATQPVNTICLTDSNTIYVGLGDWHGGINAGSGIRKSTDGGATWTSIGASMGNIGVTKIIAIGANNSTLIATTGGGTDFYGGIFRSTDAGATWTRVENTPNVAWSGLTASLPDGSGNRILYAAAAAFAPSRLYRSTDQGLNWTAVTVPGTAGGFVYGYDVAASKTDRNRVYFLGPEERMVLQSNDQGANWTDITAGMNTSNGYNWSQYFYNYHINVSTLPNSNGTLFDAVYVGNIDLSVYSGAFGATPWKSVGGPTWSGSNSVLHNDQHSFAVNPSDPNLGLIGNDGGVFRLRYNTATSAFEVTPVNRRMYTHMFYHMDVHPTLDNTLLGGTQDNAAPLVQGDLENWRNVAGGDGAYSAINRNNPNIQYSSAQFLAVVKTTDSWATSNWISPNFGADRVPFIAPFELNQGNQNQLLAGTNYIWGYNEPTNTWTKLNGTALATDEVSAIESTPDPLRFYVGGNRGEIWRTTDGGATMTSIDTAALPNRPIRDIDALDSNPRVVIAVLGSTGADGHIYRTDDADAATPTWVDISGTGPDRLPDVPAHSVVRDPLSPSNKLWLGTDIGIFVTENGGTTWLDATSSLSLPKVIVHKLHYDPRTKFLYAATYGRGIYRTNIGATGLTAFTISPGTVSRGQAAPAVGSVTMIAPVPTARVVNLSWTGMPSGVVIPSTVTVPANSISGSFNINVQNAGSTGLPNITASFDGVTITRPLTITVPVTSTVSVNPSSVPGGNSSTGTVTLNAPALAGGSTVPLFSTNTVYATVPANVTVPAGQTSTTFPIQSNRVATGGSATISSQGRGAVLTVLTSNLQSVTTTPTEGSAGSGVTHTGRVTLTGVAPTGGVVVNLSSSNTTYLTVPATVTVPAGQNTAEFPLTVLGSPSDNNVTITASHTVATTTWTRICNFRVRARYLTSLTLTPNAVLGGTSVQGRVTLSGPAPASWSVVTLTSNTPFAVVPATVAVPAGQTTATFNVTTTLPPIYLVATIIGRMSGGLQSASVNITENRVTNLVFSPTVVRNGVSSTGTVTIGGVAPTGGLTVNIINPSPNALTAPATVTIPAGATSATFTVTGRAVVASTNVNVTASYWQVGVSRTITVNP